MFFGIEFVTDRESKTPAAQYCDHVVNEMRRNGILLSSLGRFKNTLKIRPPLPFDEDHLAQLIDTLTRVLDQLPPPDESAT